MRLVLSGREGILAQLPIPNDKQYSETAKTYFARMNKKHTTADALLFDLLKQIEASPVSGRIARWTQKLFT